MTDNTGTSTSDKKDERDELIENIKKNVDNIINEKCNDNTLMKIGNAFTTYTIKISIKIIQHNYVM